MPDKWKRNKNRKLRLEGKEHVSQAGNTVRAKSIKLVPCKCHYHCNDKFTMQARQNIFKDYHSLTDDRERWSYIGNCITKQAPKRRYKSQNSPDDEPKDNLKERKYSHVYTLTSNGQSQQVCKKFFCGTLDISNKKI